MTDNPNLILSTNANHKLFVPAYEEFAYSFLEAGSCHVFPNLSHKFESSIVSRLRFNRNIVYFAKTNYKVYIIMINQLITKIFLDKRTDNV